MYPYPIYDQIGHVIASCLNAARQENPENCSHYTGDLIHDGLFIAASIAANNKNFIWGIKTNGCGTFIGLDTPMNRELTRTYCNLSYCIIITKPNFEQLDLSQGYIYELEPIGTAYDSRFPYPYCLAREQYVPKRMQLVNTTSDNKERNL